jgi:hypothetical protein
LTGVYVVSGVCILFYAIKENKPFPLVLSGVAVLVAGWIFRTKGAVMSTALVAEAVLLLATGIYRLIPRSTRISPTVP